MHLARYQSDDVGAQISLKLEHRQSTYVADKMAEVW